MIKQIRCGKCNAALRFDASKLKDGVNILKCGKCNTYNKIVRKFSKETQSKIISSFPKKE